MVHLPLLDSSPAFKKVDSMNINPTTNDIRRYASISGHEGLQLTASLHILYSAVFFSATKYIKQIAFVPFLPWYNDEHKVVDKMIVYLWSSILLLQQFRRKRAFVEYHFVFVT